MAAPSLTGSETMLRGGSWVGRSVRRREDGRLLRGTGRFLDDIELPGMVHAQFVRSTIAAGTFADLRLDRVRAMPGVCAAFTAADLSLAPMAPSLDRPLSEFVPTEMPILAGLEVRYVGEPIAIVVAEDAYRVEDALESVDVTYHYTQAITGMADALAPEAPLVHAAAANNTLVDVSMFDTDGVDEAFDRADCVVSVTCSTGRQNALPMETRGAIADWDERNEQLVVHTPSQVPHQVRTVISKCLGIDERKVRVIVPDMGGGFGIKCVVGREEVAVAAAALRLRRPVKWIEDRRDALTASFLVS